MQPSEMSSHPTLSRFAQRHPRWLSNACGFFCGVAVVVLFVPQAIGQQRPGTASQVHRSESSSRESGSRIDPRLAQRIAQQTRSEKRVPSGTADGSQFSSEVSRASTDASSRQNFADRTQLSSSSTAVVPEAAPPVRRATYQSAPATRYSENPSPEPLRPTPAVEPEPALDEDQGNKFTSDSASKHAAEFEQTAVITKASHSTAEKSPGVFLDLTGEQPVADSAASAKPLGERGAEVSIETSPTQVLMRAVAWIVIALCLFSLAALGVRRYQRQRGLLPTSNARSRVLETLSLGPGRTVSLIEMAGYRALVASDAGGIKQLVIASSSFHDEFSDMEREISESDNASQRYQASAQRPQFSVTTE